MVQDDVEEILKEGCGWDVMSETSPKPTARRRRVVMSNPVCAAFRCAADLTSSEMQWLDPLGRDAEGNKTFAAAFRGRGNQIPLYICRSCCVILRAAGAPDSFYIARAIKLYERSSDGAKMVSCQWFYRAEDTILANRKGSANRVGKQELFESDSVDENSLHSIEDICEVLAEPILDNVHSWLSSGVNVVNSERYFYGSKYIPSLKCFRALNAEDLRIARLSFGASTRAIEQTAALRIIGQLIRATLLPAPSSQPALVRVSLRLRRESDGSKDVETIRLSNTVSLGSEWKRVLSSEVYGLIASRSLVTSSRVGYFEPSEAIESAILSIDQDQIARTQQSPGSRTTLSLFNSGETLKCRDDEFSSVKSCVSTKGGRVTAMDFTKSASQIPPDVPSASTDVTTPSANDVTISDTTADEVQRISMGIIANVPVQIDVYSQGVSMSTDHGAIAAAAELDGANKITHINPDSSITSMEGEEAKCLLLGLQSDRLMDSIGKQADDGGASMISSKDSDHAQWEEDSALSTESRENATPAELTSYSSPTSCAGDNNHPMAQGHPPARSKYKAPRLQIVQTPHSPDSCARSAREGRKRDEPCSSREPRRGLQIEFSGVTSLNHSISKRVRRFDSQHSRYSFAPSIHALKFLSLA